MDVSYQRLKMLIQIPRRSANKKRIEMKIVFYDIKDNDGRGALAVFNMYADENNIEYRAIGLDRGMKTENGDYYLVALTDMVNSCELEDDEVLFLDLAPRTHPEFICVKSVLEEYHIKMTIIDHHKLPYTHPVCDLIEYVHSHKKSACKLTWEHYYSNTVPPVVVELINDRDVWLNRMQPATNYLYNTFDMMNQNDLNRLMFEESKDEIYSWLHVGKIRQESTIDKEIDKHCHNIDIKTIRGYIVAVPKLKIESKYVSEVGNSVCKMYDVDLFCSMYPVNNKWGYGLRSLNGEALKFIRDNNFKGGGHDNSCGFVHDDKLY